MAIKMKFDSANQIQSPTMVLTYRSGNPIGSIIPKNIHYNESLNSYNEFSFDVYKSLDNVICKYWDDITDFKIVYCVEWDAYFEIYVTIDESNETIKHVEGRALPEAELSQIKVYGLEINTELDISRDDYEPTIIFSYKPEASLIHKLFEKTPSFEFGHIDKSIAKLQRTFTFDDITVYDALQEVAEEVKCLIELVSEKGENGQIRRVINIYDLSPFCEYCGSRKVDIINGEYVCLDDQSHKGDSINTGYGDDTTIFFSTQNLAKDVSIESNTDGVKNCFKLTAGDDLMTSTVRNCSPTKSGYLWHFTEDTKANMSDELRSVINHYQSVCNGYNTEFNDTISYGVISDWNGIVNRYNEVCNKYQNKIIKDEPIDYRAPQTFIKFSDIMNLYYNTIDLELYLTSEMSPINQRFEDVNTTPPSIQEPEQNPTVSTEINKVNKKIDISLPFIDELMEEIDEFVAENAILSRIKSIISSVYNVVIDTIEDITGGWRATIKVENEEKTEVETKEIEVSFNNDAKKYTIQSIEDSLAKQKLETPEIIGLFDIDGDYDDIYVFQSQIKRYALNPLIRIRDAGQACLNLMIENGVTGDKPNSLWMNNWQNKNPGINLKTDLYDPYYNKVAMLNAEIETRKSEIEKVVSVTDDSGRILSDGMMSALDKIILDLREKMDLENFIKTNYSDNYHSLLVELVSFRREDTYKNDNFISDGLNNAQLFARALEFVEEAEKEIKSAAVPVHTISTTLKNLLVMPEFKPLVKYFKVGNWIRGEIDGVVYKLRLIKYEISFDDIENINVEFSDVQLVKDSVADIQSILNQASSIASNYSNIKIATSNNKKASNYVHDWVNNGLSLTKMKIVDGATNQNILWDENGFLCREYSPLEKKYDNRQLKIINKGLYITDDNWETTRAGIGNFVYYDPSDGKYKESYGVIADTLVGNLILSESVGIYNVNNSIRMDKDGFVITATNNSGNVNAKPIFEINKNNNNDIEQLLWVDTSGDLHVKGEISATGGTFTGSVVGSEISGGSLSIGKGNTRAEITAEGKLIAEGAEIKGTLSAGHIRSENYNGTGYNPSSTSGLFMDLENGNLNLGGKLKYENGTLIVEGEIRATSLRIGSGNTSLDDYISNNAIQKDTVYSGNASSSDPDGYDAATGGFFYVDSNGNLWAKNATFSGTVHSTAGDIGGWNISSEGIYLASDSSQAYIKKPIGTTAADKNSSYFMKFVCHDNNGDENEYFGVTYGGWIDCNGVYCRGAISSDDSIIAPGLHAQWVYSNYRIVIASDYEDSEHNGIYHTFINSDGNEVEIPIITTKKDSQSINIGCETMYEYEDGTSYPSVYAPRVNIRSDIIDIGYVDCTAKFMTSGRLVRIGYNGYERGIPSYESRTGNTKWIYLDAGTSAGTITMTAASFVDNAGIGTVSDFNAKQDIKSFTSQHELLFNNITPRTFKYIDGNSGRTHFGFIAQELRDAAINAGFTTQDIAAFMTITEEDGSEKNYIRYQELISLNTHMIQKCLKEITSLKAENESLKQQILDIITK